MMRRYVHLGINPTGAGGLRPLNANGILEKYLGQHADWYRYGNQNYVLCTSSELSELANGIKQLPGFQRAYIFLSEIHNFGHFGWMDPKFWEWINGRRQW